MIKIHDLGQILVSKSFPIVFFIMLSICMSVMYAQSNSGNIKGQVVDASTGEPLPGANIFLKGTALGSSTDIEGIYRVQNVSSGQYEMIVSYIGYQKQTISVEVLPNKTVMLDIKLGLAVFELGERVIITAQREGQAQAINQQITSDQIVNIISEQKIKELPDANAAEAVGRLPGVAIQRDGGEASKLMIRGLDPKFTNITVNGIQIPASGAERRDVDLSMISQSTLSGIELYKALTPDQDADAIAGVVNLVTGKAKSGQKIRVELYGMYSGLTKSAKQYRADVQYSNRFFNDLFGVQAGINASQRDRSRELHRDAWTIVGENYRINNLTVQFDDETRKRYGGNLNLDMNTGDGGNIKFINLYSYTSREAMTSYRNYTWEGSVNYFGRATDRNISTLSNSLIGENYLGALKINWVLAHAYTENETPYDHTMRFIENQSTESGMDVSGIDEVEKLPGENLIPFAYNAFHLATLDRAFFHTEANDERNYDFKVDLEYPFTLSNNLAGIVKAGYKYRDKTRNRDYNEKESIYYLRGIYDYYFDKEGNIIEKDWANSLWPNHPNALLTDYLSGPPYPSRKLDGRYLLNPVIDEDKVRSWYEINKNGTNENGLSNEYYDQLASIRRNYSVNEKVHGTYAMFKLNAGQIVTLIGGVRYEAENNEYTAKYAPRIVGVFESQSATVSDTTSIYKKEYWLPNAHLKISPFEWLDFRFAFSKSISRPDYLMRLPSLYINNQDQEIFSGNPNLEPAISSNYDINVSFYSSQFGLLTVSVFRKNIDNIFYWLQNIKLINGEMAEEFGLPLEEYGPFNQYDLDMPVNTQETKVEGVEIDLQTHLSFLPGLLKDIVVSANYSRIWSETKYPRFELIQSDVFPPKPPTINFYETKRELSGQTDYTANLTVGYDYKGFSFRVSGYFQGPYLALISNIENQDEYQKSFSRWDLALKQIFSDNITGFLNVNNFTNTVEGRNLNFRDLDLGGYLYGASAEFGLQLSL